MLVRTSLRLLSLVVLALTLSADLSAQAPKPGRFTVDQFRGLRFLEGDWVGSGYSKPFFERYTFVNDSTIQMSSFSDSAFSKPGDTGTYSLRNGEVRTKDGAALIRIDSLGFHFSTLVASPYPWVFRRVSANRWTATLGAGPRPTVYTMDRVARPKER